MDQRGRTEDGDEQQQQPLDLMRPSFVNMTDCRCRLLSQNQNIEDAMIETVPIKATVNESDRLMTLVMIATGDDLTAFHQNKNTEIPHRMAETGRCHA